jgi:hypothetical protein
MEAIARIRRIIGKLLLEWEVDVNGSVHLHRLLQAPVVSKAQNPRWRSDPGTGP